MIAIFFLQIEDISSLGSNLLFNIPQIENGPWMYNKGRKPSLPPCYVQGDQDRKVNDFPAASAFPFWGLMH